MLEPPRFDLTQLDPEAYRHLTQLEGLIARHVDPTLYHLIKLRASQINGCAFCLQMHTAEALKHGETPERMVALDGWHESPLYTDRERAVLAWTDELTLIAESHASSEAFEALKPHFSEEEIGWLVLAWTVVGVREAFRPEEPHVRPDATRSTETRKEIARQR